MTIEKPKNQTLGANYSRVINPFDYNRIMTDQHLYIAVADQYIINFIKEQADNSPKKLEVIELGCGPARVLQHLQNTGNINTTGIDIDDNFIEYGKTIITDPNITIKRSDVITYQHDKAVDIFFSEGFHHHLPKGEETVNYLKNIYNQLKPGGYCVIGDEFIPEYSNDYERDIRLIIWYCHIIANGQKRGYNKLAYEEAKTLLDDLNEGWEEKNIKSDLQIDLVLAKSKDINNAAVENIKKGEELAESLLKEIKSHLNYELSNIENMDISRGDYKISDSIFRRELGQVGFKYVKSKSFGPIETIGAMVVYIFQK